MLTPAARAISSAVVSSKASSNPRSPQSSRADRMSFRRVSRDRRCCNADRRGAAAGDIPGRYMRWTAAALPAHAPDRRYHPRAVTLFGLRFDLRNPAFAGVDTGERCRAALDMSEWADGRAALVRRVVGAPRLRRRLPAEPLVMAAAIAARTSTVAHRHQRRPRPVPRPAPPGRGRRGGGPAQRTAASTSRSQAATWPSEFDMFGVAPNSAPARVRETVATLRAAWTGEPFEFRGRTVRVTPTPCQPGGPKILMGGSE